MVVTNTPNIILYFNLSILSRTLHIIIKNFDPPYFLNFMARKLIKNINASITSAAPRHIIMFPIFSMKKLSSSLGATYIFRLFWIHLSTFSMYSLGIILSLATS